MISLNVCHYVVCFLVLLKKDFWVDLYASQSWNSISKQNTELINMSMIFRAFEVFSQWIFVSLTGSSQQNREGELEGSPPGVTLVSVTKEYEGHKAAVQDLSLTFYRDQITALLGTNGAGKTTIMWVPFYPYQTLGIRFLKCQFSCETEGLIFFPFLRILSLSTEFRDTGERQSPSWVPVWERPCVLNRTGAL